MQGRGGQKPHQLCLGIPNSDSLRHIGTPLLVSCNPVRGPGTEEEDETRLLVVELGLRTGIASWQ